MGRIEDAIAKAQQRYPGTRSTAPAPVLRNVAKDTERGSPARPEHAYGGNYVAVDDEALQLQGFLVPDDHRHRLADEYRVMKRPLLRNASSTRDPILKRGNLLMVASATPGEGKTFTCVNLCLSIAREEDWTVVLVDGDCSKPHLTRLFGAEGAPGLTDLLRNPDLTAEQLIMPTSIPGLSLLPAGARNEHAVELLASARMETICSQLSSSDPQRMIVFDSSPLLYTTESPVLASQVGQIAMVVRADKTPQQAVLAALEKLDRAKPVNLILNQVVGNSTVAGYGYGYGDYGDQRAKSSAGDGTGNDFA